MKKTAAIFTIIIFISLLTLSAFASSSERIMGRVEDLLETREYGRVQQLLGIPKTEISANPSSEKKKNSTPTNAVNKHYLPELGLEVTIPSGYSVITRSTSANAPIFNTLGATRAEILSHFESNNIYLNAISNSFSEEIVITMNSNTFNDFSLLSDSSLEIIVSGVEKTFNDYGATVSSYEIYHHPQTKFIKLYFSVSDDSIHGVQYFTVADGKATNFTLRSYTNSLSQKQENNIKAIVDSITFDKAPLSPAVGADTEAFVYSDTDTGVTFTVPANWKKEVFTKERDFIDVKFVSTKDTGITMIYGSTDVWAQLPASAKVGYSRADFNNSAFTKSDIAEMYGTTPDKISTVTYNGIQYFIGEYTHFSDEYGLDVSVTMTDLVCVDNGWLYTFQFSGLSSHKLYSDFESLLKSVHYPSSSFVGDIGSSINTSIGFSSTNFDPDYNSTIVPIVILLIILAIFVVAVVFARKKNLKSARTHRTPSRKFSSSTKRTLFCESCGQETPPNSKFCHLCGAKTIKKRWLIKVLIWIGCFFATTLLNVLLVLVTGYRAGFLPLYFAMFILPKKLCNKYEQHKEVKAMVKKAVASSSVSAIETNNIQYCKKCGKKLLDNSRFCRNCGTEVTR